MNNYDSVISSFYLAYFGRPADPEGLVFWSAHLQRANGNMADITRFFAESEEAVVRFDAKTTSERIEDVYLQLFNREPDAAGLAFWAEAIDSGRTTLADVSMEILKGAQGSDVVISGKRQAAADEFTKVVAELDAKFIGHAAVKASHAMLLAINESTTQATMLQVVQSLVPMADALSVNPSVLDAIVRGGGIDALFLTARGRAEPENLFFAMSDLTKAAAGNPATLDALLRGGGMGKVLEVMPSKASLADVVGALGKGGLDAAVEVVYPTPKPTPIPAPVTKIDFSAGTLTLSGNATDPAVVDLGKQIVTINGKDVSVSGKIEKVIAGDYAGKVALSGTIGELHFVGPQSPGVDLQIVDSKSAIFTIVDGAPVIEPVTRDLVIKSTLIKLNEAVSAKEYAVLTSLPGFDSAKLQSSVDLVAPVAGKIVFEGLDFADADGTIAYTNLDSISFKSIGAEARTVVSFQKFSKQDAGWLDLPAASVKGLAEGEHKFRSVVQDAAGNISFAEALVNIDKTAPTVTKLQFAQNSGVIAAGKSIALSVTFDSPVIVSEDARIRFSNEGSAVYQSGSGSKELVFSYTPLPGHSTQVLALDPLIPFSGKIADLVGNTMSAQGIVGVALGAAPEVDATAPAQAITFNIISQSTGIGANLGGSNAPLQTNQEAATVYATMDGYLGLGEYVEYSLDDGASWTRDGVKVTESSIAIENVPTLASPTMMLRVLDAAGNHGPVSSRAIVFDDVPPQAGSLAFASVSESEHDTSKGDNVTDVAVASVTFQHSGAWLAEGDRLQYSTNGVHWSSIGLQADVTTGEVSIVGLRLDQGSLLDDGARLTNVAVRAVDAAGNPSVLGSQDLMYKPHVAAPVLQLYRDSGIDGDGITNVDQVIVSNLSKVGTTTWEYSLNNGTSWIPGYGNDQDGRASFMVSKDGDYQVLVRQKVNGVDSATGKIEFTLDTEVPELSHYDNHIDGDKADVVFKYTGSLGATDKIEYQIDDGGWLSDDRIELGAMGTIVVKGVDLASADPKVELRVSDLAGNESVPASATVDGPYTDVVPSFTASATAGGLLVTSTVNGTLYVQGAPGTAPWELKGPGGATGVLANTPFLVGPQDQVIDPATYEHLFARGTIVFKTASGKEVTDPAGTLYQFGTDAFDHMIMKSEESVTAWAFGGERNNISAKGGNDSLYGGDSDDVLIGGAGNDLLVGGGGVNTLEGGKGADRIDISKGQNTLVYNYGDSTAASMDVVNFAADAGDNLALQKFMISVSMTGLFRTDKAVDPATASTADLISALNAAYQGQTDGAYRAALIVQFNNKDTYLVVDGNDGRIDATDHVIKLVGQVPDASLDGISVVFGPTA